MYATQITEVKKNEYKGGWGTGCLDKHYCSEYKHVNSSVGEVMNGIYGQYPSSGFLFDIGHDESQNIAKLDKLKSY